ncbi:MAG: sigma-70 family RNA polymerase sigma factor [Sedimentisphaerales bacterium]|nr:sigma-70 family RNA polymerase sigma factor [Sedimentisphaerales bacterium]MBN2843232.1 sigma-70 family RNA polymerase sigma factor [Sedimentisphaerales bacterium]
MFEEDRKQNRNGSNTPEYFLYLLTPVQGRLYAFILSRWPNKSDADDIMQEVISVLWSKFDSYEPGTEFLAWAFTVTKYILSGFRRKHKNYPVQFSAETLEMLDKHTDEFNSVYDNRIETLRECVKKLPVRDLSLLKLKYEEGLPSQKIASRFGMSVRTFYRNISKAHAILMQCMSLSSKAGGV